MTQTELLNTIRTHIDQQYEGNREKARYDDYYRGMNDGLDKLEQFLDTLPEQPVEGLDVTDFCKPVDPGIAKCVADHWWELLDDENAADKNAVKEIVKTTHKEVTRQVKKMVKEQPDGLEEEIKRYWKEEMPVVLESDLNDIARHFAEWGAAHLKR